VLRKKQKNDNEIERRPNNRPVMKGSRNVCEKLQNRGRREEKKRGADRYMDFYYREGGEKINLDQRPGFEKAKLRRHRVNRCLSNPRGKWGGTCGEMDFKKK